MDRRLACIFFALSLGCSNEPPVKTDRAAGQRAGDDQGEDDDDQGGDGECKRDAYEKNETADTAATLAFDSIFPQQAFLSVEGFLCANEEDWFHIPTESLPWETVTVRLRVFAANAGFCADFGCEGFLPTAGPEHTLTVEAYHAMTGTLLGSATDEQGIVRIDGSTAWGDGVLIRIQGPPEAEYPYLLRFSTWDFDGEDECEC